MWVDDFPLSCFALMLAKLVSGLGETVSRTTGTACCATAVAAARQIAATTPRL
jgi:hypothetical protein